MSAFHAIRDELVSTLYFMLGNRDDAQDVVQAAFLNCWQARAGLVNVRDLRAWLFRAALNAAKDLTRSAWRRKRRPLEPILHEQPGAGASPVELLIGREEAAWLSSAVAGLRPAEREVFRLRLNEGFTYQQIANLRGMPIGTVKTQMRLALLKLRRLFQHRGARHSIPNFLVEMAGPNRSHASGPQES